MTMTTTELATALTNAKYGSPKYMYELLKDANDRKTPVAVTDATTYSVLDANSDRLHVIPNFTATCTATLPAGVTGMRYRFVSKAVAADAQNFVLQTAGAGVLFLGGVTFHDEDGDVSSNVFADASDDRILTLVTPAAGTRIEVVFDGTSWIVNGAVHSATTPAFS